MYPLPEKVSWYKNTLLEGKQRSATLKRKENSLAFEWCNLFVFLAPLRRVPSSKKSASKLSGGFWLRGGKRKESLQLHVKNTWKQVRAKGNDVITNVISANQHFASTFSMQIFKFQRRSCKISLLFPPHLQSISESLLAGYSAACFCFVQRAH